MKLEVSVNNRALETAETYRIPSRSQNDVFICFHIEPGYGWEALEKTAEFSRVEGKTWKVNIQPDTYYLVPNEAISTEGILYVSLIGCGKDGTRLATSLPVTLTVYRSALDLMRPTPYPKDEEGDPSPDAYAQYVALVTKEANRAEEAALRVENVAVGWYTKEECDERFAKRVKLSATASETFDLSLAVMGTIPELDVKGLPPDTAEGSIEHPVPMTSIEGLRFSMGDKTTSVDVSYTGFVLRRLTDELYDEMIIDSSGAHLVQCVHSVKGSDVTGMWLTDTQYAFNTITQPDLNPAYNDDILFNVGDVTYEVRDNSVIVDFPTKPTDEQLAAVEFWYALDTPETVLISNTAIPAVPSKAATLSGFKTINQEESPLAAFGILVELDITKYLNSFLETINDLNKKVQDAQEAVQVLTETVEKKAVLTKVDFTAEEFVSDEIYGKHFNINDPDIEIIAVNVTDASGAKTALPYKVFKTNLATIVSAEAEDSGTIIYASNVLI